jgi:hypothetical protein
MDGTKVTAVTACRRISPVRWAGSPWPPGRPAWSGSTTAAPPVSGQNTGLLAIVYFGSVLVTQTIFQIFTGRTENSQLTIVLSTLVIAALFNPLRRRVQMLINRRFYRQNYDAALTLAHFAATARDEVDLTNLTHELVRVVDKTMRPAHISLWLRENEPEGDP